MYQNIELRKQLLSTRKQAGFAGHFARPSGSAEYRQPKRHTDFRTNKLTDKKTDRRSNKQTDRQKRQTDVRTNKLTDKKKDR